MTLFLQPDSYAKIHETTRMRICMHTETNSPIFKFFALNKQYQKDKQNTSKDAGIIALDDNAISENRLVC